MQYKKLKDIADLIGGYAFKSDKYVSSGIRIIRIANVQDGYISDDYPCFYPLNKETEIGNAILEENDLLMSLTGNVGRVAILSRDLLPAGLNQRVECIRPKNLNLKQYLYYYFRSEHFKQIAEKNSSGIAQLNMSTIWLGEHQIPIYESEKTFSIVKQLRTIDDLIALEQKQLNLYDELIKSRFIEMFGSIESMQNSTDKLGNIVEINPKKVELDDNLKVSFIPMEKVGIDCSIDTSYERPVSEIKKGFSQVKENDVLFAKITPCMENGKSSIARGLINGYGYSTTELFNLRCNDKALPEFVLTLIHMNEFRVLAKSNMKGAVGQQRVPKTFLEDFPIVIPDMNKQNEFASFVRQIDKSKFIVQKRINLYKELLDKKMNEFFE